MGRDQHVATPCVTIALRSSPSELAVLGAAVRLPGRRNPGRRDLRCPRLSGREARRPGRLTMSSRRVMVSAGGHGEPGRLRSHRLRVRSAARLSSSPTGHERIGMQYEDFFSDGVGDAVVDVPALFDSGIPGQVAELVSMGVLVSIGTTRDRGAVSIRITSDGRSRRAYFRDAADATDWLRLAVAAVSGRGVGEPERQAAVIPKPSRGRRTAS